MPQQAIPRVWVLIKPINSETGKQNRMSQLFQDNAPGLKAINP